MGLAEDSNFAEDSEVYDSVGKYNPGMPEVGGEDL